ncbi:hypothetical protein MUP95_01970, partial [bacterium]|nr:hypothetical protein [bacterium]
IWALGIAIPILLPGEAHRARGCRAGYSRSDSCHGRQRRYGPGGGFRAVQDVPPFILAASEPLQYKGLNAVGLRRRGYSSHKIELLRKCYRFIYRSNLNRSHALEKIKSEIEMTPEVQSVCEFIEKSRRGII